MNASHMLWTYNTTLKHYMVLEELCAPFKESDSITEHLLISVLLNMNMSASNSAYVTSQSHDLFLLFWRVETLFSNTFH